MNNYIALLLGVICAGIGGEFFVRGAVGLAFLARVSPGIIGATVVAFATSSPELSVSINAALAGQPEISLGDALGSNILNVALILGLALVIEGIHSSRDSVKRDFPVALIIPLITAVLLLDGELSRVDGILMLLMFFIWIAMAIVEARKQRSAAEIVLGEHRVWKIILLCAGGLAFLVGAGHLIVIGARGIALTFGLDEFIIGATVVAVGTSVPELATTVIAKLRGHDEISLGTILGSNIFNGIFVIAIAAIIHPIHVAWREVAITLGVGFMALIFALPGRNDYIGRHRGVILLLLYVTYLAIILHQPA